MLGLKALSEKKTNKQTCNIKKIQQQQQQQQQQQEKKHRKWVIYTAEHNKLHRGERTTDETIPTVRAA